MAYPVTNPKAPLALYHLPSTYKAPNNASAPNPDGGSPGVIGANSAIARRVRIGYRSMIIGFNQP